MHLTDFPGRRLIDWGPHVLVFKIHHYFCIKTAPSAGYSLPSIKFSGDTKADPVLGNMELLVDVSLRISWWLCQTALRLHANLECFCFHTTFSSYPFTRAQTCIAMNFFPSLFPLPHYFLSCSISDNRIFWHLTPFQCLLLRKLSMKLEVLRVIWENRSWDGDLELAHLLCGRQRMLFWLVDVVAMQQLNC